MTKENNIEYTEENPNYRKLTDKFFKKIYRDDICDIFPKYNHPKIIETSGDRQTRLKKMENYLIYNYQENHMAIDDMRRFLILKNHYLPSRIAQMVCGTQKSFLQVIYSLKMPKNIYKRFCLLGDASDIYFPHIGSVSAKAIKDAIFNFYQNLFFSK